MKSKMISCVIILLVVSHLAHAQSRGIQFEKGLSWAQILAKAKAEHKYLFVDGYASWCGPCRQMDIDVYPNDTVGRFMNSHFISVRIQLDTAKNDNDSIKMFYADAHQLSTKYNIRVYPTYLFLDSDGNIVHRAIGYQKSSEFLQTAGEALDSNTQYYTQLEAYKSGVFSYEALPQLALDAKKIGDKELAQQVACDYLSGYLEKTDEQSFLTRKNIQFLEVFAATLTSKSRLLRICLERPAVIDTLMHDPKYAGRWINYIVVKEEIIPKVKVSKPSGKMPDWQGMTTSITSKYGAQYIGDHIINAKIDWYKFKKDTAHYYKYRSMLADKAFRQNGISAGAAIVFTNNLAYEIFEYDNDQGDLVKALSWCVKINLMGSDGSSLDTEANLLYKLGRKTNALKVEESAMAAEPSNKDIYSNYQKMKKGLKTWDGKLAYSIF